MSMGGRPGPYATKLRLMPVTDQVACTARSFDVASVRRHLSGQVSALPIACSTAECGDHPPGAEHRLPRRSGRRARLRSGRARESRGGREGSPWLAPRRDPGELVHVDVERLGRVLAAATKSWAVRSNSSTADGGGPGWSCPPHASSTWESHTVVSADTSCWAGTPRWSTNSAPAGGLKPTNSTPPNSGQSGASIGYGAFHQQRPHFGGDGIRAAGPSAQWAGVLVPGGVHGGGGVRLSDRAIQVADTRGAACQFGDSGVGAARRLLPQVWVAGRSRSPCIPPSTASAVPVTLAAAGLAR